MFYDTYTQLCIEKGVSRSKAASEMGLSNSIVTKWKKTGATPSGETMSKIANYFGVTVDYLLGKTESKPDILKEIDISFYGDYKALDDEQKELLREMARTMRRHREEKGVK